VLLTLSGSFDYNDDNRGTSFKAWNKDWKKHEMIKDFAKWGKWSFGESPFRFKKITLMCQWFRSPADQWWQGWVYAKA
jgi:hypothetical protein